MGVQQEVITIELFEVGLNRYFEGLNNNFVQQKIPLGFLRGSYTQKGGSSKKRRRDGRRGEKEERKGK